jgi:hypothetical protein
MKGGGSNYLKGRMPARQGDKHNGGTFCDRAVLGFLFALLSAKSTFARDVAMIVQIRQITKESRRFPPLVSRIKEPRLRRRARRRSQNLQSAGLGGECQLGPRKEHIANPEQTVYIVHPAYSYGINRPYRCWPIKTRS